MLPSEQSSAPTVEGTPAKTQFPATGTPFILRYDKLVIGVGAYPQTFNVPGVKEHAHFLKDVRYAQAIGTRILDCTQRRSIEGYCHSMSRDEVGEKNVDRGTRPMTSTRGVEGSRGVEETCSDASIEGEGAQVRE